MLFRFKVLLINIDSPFYRAIGNWTPSKIDHKAHRAQRLPAMLDVFQHKGEQVTASSSKNIYIQLVKSISALGTALTSCCGNKCLSVCILCTRCSVRSVFNRMHPPKTNVTAVCSRLLRSRYTCASPLARKPAFQSRCRLHERVADACTYLILCIQSSSF